MNNEKGSARLPYSVVRQRHLLTMEFWDRGGVPKRVLGFHRHDMITN